MEGLLGNTYFWIAVGVAAFVVIVYNRIIAAGNGAMRAWAGVITYERQKNKLIPPLTELNQQYGDFESGLQSKITQLRGALGKLSDKDMNPQAAAAAEAITRDLVQALRVTVEAYPDLKANQVYQQLMREMAIQQENIAAAIQVFNLNAESHNNLIQSFPSNIVNGILNKRKVIATFHDAEASSGFDYSPNL